MDRLSCNFIHLVCLLVIIFTQTVMGQQPATSPAPDERLKADILVVVAHPDDESIIDPADTLFEPDRVPRQLEVHDQAAARLQVESVRRGVGGQQHVGAAARECVHRVGPRGEIQATVDDGDTRQSAEDGRRDVRACRGTR